MGDGQRFERHSNRSVGLAARLIANGDIGDQVTRYFELGFVKPGKDSGEDVGCIGARHPQMELVAFADEGQRLPIGGSDSVSKILSRSTAALASSERSRPAAAGDIAMRIIALPQIHSSFLTCQATRLPIHSQ